MVKEHIKKIIGIEVSSDNLDQLMKNPEAYTKSKEDAQKLEQLFYLMELMQKSERAEYEVH